MKHRSFSIYMHRPEDMVTIKLAIKDNVDLNSEGARRGQFQPNERCEETLGVEDNDSSAFMDCFRE